MLVYQRKCTLPVVGSYLFTAARRIGDWGDGSDGHGWKTRDLAERRHLALEYMGNVQNRQPIHDAIREKYHSNRRALNQISSAGELFVDTPDQEIAGSDEDLEDGFDALKSAIEDLLSEECDVGNLEHLSRSDAEFLQNEFLGSLGDNDDDGEMLKRWLKFKSMTSDYKSYASIPAGEISTWSAWYLRNVKPGSDSDSDL